MRAIERQALQKHMNELIKIRDVRDNCFLLLQDKCRVEALPVYCSAQMNFIQLQATCKAKEALVIYSEYMKCDGQISLLDDFGTILAEIGFWKKQ